MISAVLSAKLNRHGSGFKSTTAQSITGKLVILEIMREFVLYKYFYIFDLDHFVFYFFYLIYFRPQNGFKRFCVVFNGVGIKA